MLRAELINKFAARIALYEGFYKPNSLAQRNNNPGNLRRWGKTPVIKGYAKFNTLDEGWAALKAQISKNMNRNLTFYEFFAGKYKIYAGYAPLADKNNPTKYAEFVASEFNVGIHKVINTLVK